MKNEKMIQLASMSMDELEESIQSLREELSFHQQVFEMRRRGGEATTKQIQRRQKRAEAKQKEGEKSIASKNDASPLSGFASESPAGHGDSTK